MAETTDYKEVGRPLVDSVTGGVLPVQIKIRVFVKRAGFASRR